VYDFDGRMRPLQLLPPIHLTAAWLESLDEPCANTGLSGTWPPPLLPERHPLMFFIHGSPLRLS
jgi:hypothetical protein